MDQSKYKVFVGNLNFRTTKRTLIKVFSECGEVVDVSIPIYHDRKRPKGYAFVEFENIDSAKLAIEKFNGRAIDGREVIVNSAAPDKKTIKITDKVD